MTPSGVAPQAVRLLPGAESFVVDELLAYTPCGSGEHLYVQVEKRDLATDRVADALAQCCGCARRAVGFAGRKDRSAVARQWFSVLGAREEALRELEAQTGGRARPLEVTRHRNKIRLGHLLGNRFRLTLQASDPEPTRARLEAELARIGEQGFPHRFGAQRFGRGGSTLRVAIALGEGRPWDAVRWQLDPAGRWQPGDPLPAGASRGFEGRMRASLRRSPQDPQAALCAAGRDFAQLAASAAQSAVFNAVLEARSAAGLLYRVRAGDVVRKIGGGPFVCSSEDLDDVNRRAAPGCLEVVATGPLPGTAKLVPSEAVRAEEREWSRETGVAWEWFERGGSLESPGERRPLWVRPLDPPRCTVGSSSTLVLEVGLPRGTYATELLSELGVTLPANRSRPEARLPDGSEERASAILGSA